MNDIIQNLETNATNGKENFCYISEKQLNAMKELSKREAKENKQLKDNWNKLKVYILTQDMENLYSASKELIKSIDKDYLEVIINLDEPKAYFKKPELAVITVKRIVVPIKQDLLENYVYWINYYKSKYELGDDK